MRYRGIIRKRDGQIAQSTAVIIPRRSSLWDLLTKKREA